MMKAKTITLENQKRLEIFGIYIRELRRNQGLTQIGLRKNLNSPPHRNTIIRAEAGKNISILTVFELADALDVEIKELFELVE